ncbi:MAG: hypothetical protein HC903_24200 [Methylacidiphilales bacterium]|nr:hypothetical protein [Candidatus Methylacidiphilales bacterium]NJR18357.1 hypothetical protein [Calothrix sp. CSU_2_0]
MRRRFLTVGEIGGEFVSRDRNTSATQTQDSCLIFVLLQVHNSRIIASNRLKPFPSPLRGINLKPYPFQTLTTSDFQKPFSRGV